MLGAVLVPKLFCKELLWLYKVVLHLIQVAAVFNIDAVFHCAREGLAEWISRSILDISIERLHEDGIFGRALGGFPSPSCWRSHSGHEDTSDFLCVWVRVEHCMT